MARQDQTQGPASRKVRIALHTGAAEEREGDYFGPPLNRVARLLAAGSGFLAYHQGEHEARVFLEQSLALQEALPAEVWLGDVLHNLANVMLNLGDSARSRLLHQRALAARRERGQKWGVGWSLLGLAELARQEGSYEEAAALLPVPLRWGGEADERVAPVWGLLPWR